MLDWFASAFELIGGWLVGNKVRWGFVCFLLCNVCWIMYVVITRSTYGLLLVVVPSTLINIRNFIRWSQNARDNTGETVLLPDLYGTKQEFKELTTRQGIQDKHVYGGDSYGKKE